MRPGEIKTIMAKLGGATNKRLGQHFLIDRVALETVVKEAHLHPAMVTLEIGPGLGVLSAALLAAGHNVVAIERDARFISYLDSRFHGNDRWKIVRADAGDIDWMQLVGNNEWQLVANLPYAISSLALRFALWTPRPAENIVVMVQREVAERIIARDGKTSLLSLMVALASSESRIIKRVAPGAFYPPPKVDSAILRIVPLSLPERIVKWGIEPERIMEVAKKGFAHPRKLLFSNLKSALGPQFVMPDAVELERMGINANARAEDLSPEKWAALARYHLPHSLLR